ncbi:hypothetical protein KCH_56170 [Kitasatospora cheerisanensis KCTC 2395]|uniref:Uncharacterized protein n=1 Tax=Kitasatospora cheerisanensis KCTC 2395 TaxID=1348663 RepID=A0A066YNH5_9ACTN|nr:hypothetical protein KCH_56170 [Kitasatospora cheerisanensis KCTC 2395]
MYQNGRVLRLTRRSERRSEDAFEGQGLGQGWRTSRYVGGCPCRGHPPGVYSGVDVDRRNCRRTPEVRAT